MIKDLQRCGSIEESDSHGSSPVVLVQKDGDLRFCVDYGKLDNITRKDCFSMLGIDDTRDMLSGVKWFSTPDFKSGYWQVVLHSDGKEKTVF